MKKLMSLVLVLAMTATLLAGCGQKPEETQAPETQAPVETQAPETQAPETQAPTEPAVTGGLKTGLAVVGGLSEKSADAGEKDGLAQSDLTAAAVLVDADGVIVDCKIDVAQNKINFTADGKVVAPEKILSKQELKEDYNMKGVSGIGKEWYEQADAFAAYVIGKTAEEVKAIAVDDATHPTDADITAGCTMAVGDMIAAIVNAVETATECGAQAGDVLGLGLATDAVYSSKDAGEKDGLAQADTTYVAATSNNGVVTSCIVDVTQAKVNFDATGKITSDLTAPIITKDTQKGDYGMLPASPIGKEWFEQADAFEAFVVGKTAADVAVGEDGKATDADLLAGCTMSIGDFVAALAKATK